MKIKYIPGETNCPFTKKFVDIKNPVMVNSYICIHICKNHPYKDHVIRTELNRYFICNYDRKLKLKLLNKI
jgi:hypothetical protein